MRVIVDVVVVVVLLPLKSAATVVQVAGRACGGNHHSGSSPSPCGNYPASSRHQSGTGFDPAQVKPSRVKWTAA
ncbi:hypothetical protein Bca101_040046 [Brassica carinata]